MKLAIFGCSWTHGIHSLDNHRNWPYYLAAKNPQYQVYNYAIAASSLQFQIYLYEYVKKHMPADRYIFQVTRPERFTYFEPGTKFEELLEDRKFYNDHLGNYKWFNYATINKTVQPVTIGNVKKFFEFGNNGFTKDSIDFAHLYYKIANDEIMELEWKMGIEYIKNKVDFCFLHTEGKERNIENLHCIEDMLGKDYCSQNYYEEGSGTHFNQKGLQWQADWVKEHAGL
jgi:hypothetical protein